MYAAVFLVGVLLLGALITLLVRGAPTPSITLDITPPSFDPIVVEDVSIIRHDTSVDLVARLRNPNPRAGITEYPVTFTLLDASERELSTTTVITYLLPGSIQYAVAVSVPTTRPVAEVQVDVPEDLAFVNLPNSLTLPSFGTLLQDRERLLRGAQTIEQQVGLVTNNSTFDFQRVEVIVVALDSTDRAIGVGQTFVGELKVGEQRQFTSQWPAPQVATRGVLLLATTNIFKEGNIIQAIGDPGLLR
ncbi:hypothetical protein CL628_03200 [bacterium]|nr:hypothetical protein [bacterium]|tara:strand:- start:225 stop:965 length:741 start_codon:yes stop_codon:yes gene_type:complete